MLIVLLATKPFCNTFDTGNKQVLDKLWECERQVSRENALFLFRETLMCGEILNKIKI